jgi:hypothetical protein
MACRGNSNDHCCWVAGKVCDFLEENTVEGRRWACGLRRELGDWDAVLASDRYQKDIAPTFEPMGVNCRDWPSITSGQVCHECGENL